ncbi:unnamed protein product, partial [Ectocarpus sp. 12 AP-2014]
TLTHGNPAAAAATAGSPAIPTSEPPATPVAVATAAAAPSGGRSRGGGGGASRSPARSGGGATSSANGGGGKSGSKSGGGSSSSKASGGSKKSKGSRKSKHGTVLKGWKPIDDRMACNVCMDEQDYDMNPMMQCARCKVRVHQHCYACREDTGASWLCDVCEAGEDASVTVCELCKETNLSKGGAMKQVLGNGKNGEKLWVHVSCSLWIPEVRFTSEELNPVNLDFIEKSRKILKCLLCGQKGTCVQCAGGRCLLSYHPWCLIHSDRGIINRSISVQSHLHVFCQDHKADVISSLDLEGRDCQLGPMCYQEARDRIQPKMQAGFLPMQAPSSGGKGGAKSGRLSGGKQAFKGKNSKKRNRDGSPGGLIDVEGEGACVGMDQQPQSPHVQQGRKRRRKFGPGPGGSATDAAGKGEPEPDCVDKPGALMGRRADPDIDDDGNLVLHTFWDKAGAPRIGQESLTCERFWEVMAGYFPEGHSPGWLGKLLDIEHLPKEDDPAYVIPEPRQKDKDKEKDKETGGDNAKQPKGGGGGGSSSPKSGGATGGSREDGGESDDSNPVSVDGGGALEDDDDDDDDDGLNAHRRRSGGSRAAVAADKRGKSPPASARAVRGSARLGGGSGGGSGGGGGGWSTSSDASPRPEPTVVDSDCVAASCHRQVGLVMQRGKSLRVGCRFALRVAETLEDERAIEKERAEGGVQWSRFEMPADDELDLDLGAYPGLMVGASKPRGLEEQQSATGEAGGEDDGVLLPGIAAAPPAAAGAEKAASSSGDGNGDGDGDGECDVSSLFVALQGWTKHDVDDPEVRFQPRGAVIADASREGEGGNGAAADPGGRLAHTASADDSTDIAAAAVAAADAAAAAEKVMKAAEPLPVMDDEVVQALKLQQDKLRGNTEGCLKRIDPIRAIVDPMVGEASSFAVNNDQVYTRYCRVQMWKRLYNKLHFGVADRPLNFNKVDVADCESSIPASWRRDVDGRQSKEEYEAERRAAVEQANKEDAVCMVCFDGSTDESGNLTIVYCDGCDMSVHTDCYGIQ